MNEMELGWIAGFFEGEGTFDGRGRPRVTQVDREPLERFLAIMQIGRLYGPYGRAESSHQPISHWAALGKTEALRFIELVGPHLSVRRQAQAAVAKNRILVRRSYAGTHCKYGHAFTPGNTILDPRGGRSCRHCALERSVAWQKANPDRVREIKAKHRAKLRVLKEESA